LRYVLNFIKIGHTVAEVWRFNRFFQNGCLPPFCIYWARVGTIHNDYMVVSIAVLLKSMQGFDSMKLSIFCPFALKMPIQAPQIGVFGDSTPKMGSNINETHKRHTLARIRVV